LATVGHGLRRCSHDNVRAVPYCAVRFPRHTVQAVSSYHRVDAPVGSMAPDEATSVARLKAYCLSRMGRTTINAPTRACLSVSARDRPRRSRGYGSYHAFEECDVSIRAPIDRRLGPVLEAWPIHGCQRFRCQASAPQHPKNPVAVADRSGRHEIPAGWMGRRA
jgi:hypothetical protein